ncbi:hypothetical protein D3C75_826930 [compost metagenome]
MQAIDDDPVVGLQSADHFAQAVMQLAQLYRAQFDAVLCIEHIQHLARGIDAYGRIRHQQGLVGRARGKLHAAELARAQRQVRVADPRALAQGAGGWVQAVVDEIHAPAQRWLELAWQGDAHLAAGNVAGRLAAVLQVALLVDVEVDVDGVKRDDGGQQRGIVAAAVDQVAFADQLAADTPAHGRGDTGELEVQASAGQRAFGAEHFGASRLARLQALVVQALRNGPGIDQHLGAGILLFGQGLLRTGLGQFALGLGHRRLEAARVDDEQQIALLHDCTVPEGHLLQVAADA